METQLLLKTLTMRIDRLAYGLGININDQHEVIKMLDFDIRTTQTHKTSHQASAADVILSEHHNIDDIKRAELRGLLVLRYTMQEDYATKMGGDALRSVETNINHELQQEGFNFDTSQL